MRWRSGPDHWGAVLIALHWLSMLVVFGMFVLGLWMTSLTYTDYWYNAAPYIHKSIGVLLFIATVLRLLWRLVAGRPGEFASHAPWERVAARLTHVALYLLLFGVMLSGYLIPTAEGRPVAVFGWFEVPALVSGFERQEDIAGEVHLYLAVALIGLALVHAGAALKHHIFDRDRTLLRMLGR